MPLLGEDLFFKINMRERLEAYHELKYTALNCGIETDDIPFLVDYILADFEGKKKLRTDLVKRKSRVGAVSVISQLSKINPRTLEILETSISKFMGKKEAQAREEYNSFLKQLNTDDISRKLLQRFIEDISTKLLIIPFIPKFEELSCLAINHQGVANKYGIIERIAKVTKMFRENPKVFYATSGAFIIKEDTPLIRSQIEQNPINTIQ